MRDSLGLRGQSPLDLNGDGVVNIIDVARLRNHPIGSARPNSIQGTEEIRVMPQSTSVYPGSTVSVFVLIRENSVPILGYSLDVEVIPQPGALGSLTADFSATNFYDVRNLITAGGATRDPFFSVIQDGGNGGVFINTLTEDNSTVLAQDGINDVLAQVVFQASTDASGVFHIQLGSASALSDGNAMPVPYSFTAGVVTATLTIPTVSSWGIAALIGFVLIAGSLILRSRHLPTERIDHK